MEPSAITGEEMQAIEENAVYLGVSLQQLMECAGLSVAREVASRFRPSHSCLVVAGTGRNGGDGMVAARHLASHGYPVQLLLAGLEEKIGDPVVKANWRAVKRLTHAVKVTIAGDSAQLPHFSADVVIDALLGIGVKGKLRPPILDAVRQINRLEAFKVAVDVPTGLDATTGEVLGEAVKANLTVTFHKPKIGHLRAPGLVGELVTANIGIPPEAELYAGPGDVNLVKIPRPPAAHKGDFGRVLVVGGSETFTGAPALAALAALQTGVDLVYVAAPKTSGAIISSYSPNLIVVKLTGERFNPHDLPLVEPYLQKASAVIFGPGLDLHPETEEATRLLLERLRSLEKPAVVDADGLKLLGKLGIKPAKRWVLTPHAGEFQYLTDEKLSGELETRAARVKAKAAELGSVILLKGHVDVISDGHSVKLNFTGNPGMTAGGTGDTLAGIVGGLVALCGDVFKASVAGAFVNGACGDRVAARKGHHLLPTDILEEIPALMDNPMLHAELKNS